MSEQQASAAPAPATTQVVQSAELPTKWNRRTRWAVLLLVLAAMAVRSWQVTRPLVGQFATKNAVYAMIARNVARGECSVFLPCLDVLKSQRKSLHLLEIPWSAAVAGWGWRECGGSLEVWGRSVSIVCSGLSVLLMFALVRRWHGETAAWGASATLALSPVSIIYGQMFMLEASLVMLMLTSMACVEHYLARRSWFSLAGVAMAATLLFSAKVYLLALGPVLVLRAWQDTSDAPVRPNHWRLYAVLVLAASLSLAWVAYVFALANDPQSTPYIFFSLADSTRTHVAAHTTLLSAGFYMRLIGDLGLRVLTPIGCVLALASLTQREWRRHACWLTITGLWILLMPRKFYEMNYYHLLTLPVLCVLVGLGWKVVCERCSMSWRSTTLVMLYTLGLALGFAYTPAFTVPEEDRHVVAAAEAVRQNVPCDEPIATLHGSTLDLLYYCDRPGWALVARDDLAAQLVEVRGAGARHLIVTGLEQLAAIPAAQATLAELPVVVEHPGYRLYRLPNRSE